MIENVLAQFGLSEKESSAYIVLLRYGVQTVSLLANRMDVSRGTAFFVVKSLAKKGLATKIDKNGAQHFSPVDPKYLNSILARKQAELQSLESDLKTTLPALIAMKNPSSPVPKIKFFEGKEGLCTLLEDTLTTKDRKLKGILSMLDLYTVFGEKYFESYIKRRIGAKIELQVLRNKTKDTKEAWKSNKSELREVRYLPSEMLFPSTTYLYDNKVMLISSEKERFGLLIESEEIYKMQLSLFQVAWINSVAKN